MQPHPFKGKCTRSPDSLQNLQGLSPSSSFLHQPTEGEACNKNKKSEVCFLEIVQLCPTVLQSVMRFTVMGFGEGPAPHHLKLAEEFVRGGVEGGGGGRRRGHIAQVTWSKTRKHVVTFQYLALI